MFDVGKFMVPWNNDATKVSPSLKPKSPNHRTYRDAKSRSAYSAISKACDFSRGLDRVGLGCFALAVFHASASMTRCIAGCVRFLTLTHRGRSANQAGLMMSVVRDIPEVIGRRSKRRE
jgi:hypothetical protein